VDGDRIKVVCRIDVRKPLTYVREGIFVRSEGRCVKDVVFLENNAVIDAIKPSRSRDEVFPGRRPTAEFVDKRRRLNLLVL
jgi:hypothetical protein